MKVHIECSLKEAEALRDWSMGKIRCKVEEAIGEAKWSDFSKKCEYYKTVDIHAGLMWSLNCRHPQSLSEYRERHKSMGVPISTVDAFSLPSCLRKGCPRIKEFRK